jgi:YfiH family protein
MTEISYLIPDWPAPARVRACITTRLGGQSQGPYASFNLATHVGDDPSAVADNRAALVERLGLKRKPQWLEQIHGTQVVEAADDGWVRSADGCYTRAPGLACAVMTADCLPVFVCNTSGSQVAVLHAGWRGLAKGILAKGLDTFSEPGSELMAWLGPAISQPHFEVGIEVLEAFFESARDVHHSDLIAAAFTPGKRPLHFFADIYALARAELQALGVKAIFGGNYCTYRDETRFYSFRRDKTTGRMASLIWLAD